MTLLLIKNLYFIKKVLHLTFFVISYFSPTSLNTTSPNIWEMDAWAVPTSIFFWDRPPKSPPMLWSMYNFHFKINIFRFT